MTKFHVSQLPPTDGRQRYCSPVQLPERALLFSHDLDLSATQLVRCELIELDFQFRP